MASKDLKNMDLNTLHELPTPLKLGLSALLIAAILGAGYFFVFQDQLSQLDNAKKQEETLTQDEQIEINVWEKHFKDKVG